jgi:hypothetical protein
MSKRTIIKSNSAFLIVGDSPSWKTGEESGRIFPLVQNTQFSIEPERQASAQVGSQNYAINDLFRSPNVKFNADYYASPFWVNEYLIGMDAGFGSYAPVFSGISAKNQNFYLIINENNGIDAFHEFRKETSRNLTGVFAASVGNCFLNQYSLSVSVGSVPTASVAFTASNIQFENLTGESIKIPSINLASGNSIGAGNLNLNSLQVFVTGMPDIGEYLPEYDLPVASPQETQVYLKNLQVGGPSLAAKDALVQSFNLDLTINRQDMYGLGSNHVYGRKVLFPVVGSVDISVLVSDLQDGDPSGMLISESGYDLELELRDPRYSASTSIFIENAKLESYSLDLSINERITFNAKYSFEATETGGLFAKAMSPIPSRGYSFVYLSDGSQVFLDDDQALQIEE